MGFRAAKISFDVSHYIATPKENFPQGKKRRRSSQRTSEQETECKEQFETAYKESQKLPKKERNEYVKKAMEQVIPNEEQRQEFVQRNSERKKINAIRRKVNRLGISFALSPIRTRSIRKKVLENRSGTRSNTLSTAKVGNTSAYGSAAAIQTACTSTGYSIFRRAKWSERSLKQRITARKTTGCRRRTRTPIFSNGTDVMIFKRSVRLWKYSIRSAI